MHAGNQVFKISFQEVKNSEKVPNPRGTLSGENQTGNGSKVGTILSCSSCSLHCTGSHSLLYLRHGHTIQPWTWMVLLHPPECWGYRPESPWKLEILKSCPHFHNNQDMKPVRRQGYVMDTYSGMSLSLPKETRNQWDGSEGKGTCVSAWQPGSFPRSHKVAGENRLQRGLFPHMCRDVCTHTHNIQ